MGIRSEVGFCVKPGIEVPQFEDDADVFDEVIRDERGVFYFIDSIKWDTSFSDTPQKVEEFLDGLDEEDYIFLEMYPGEGYGVEIEIKGNWWDNDFGLSYISRLCYDDETK